MDTGADYRVDLDIYNGPLDLLLYLIREREVDIQDIPIAEITDQFLAHLEVVKRIDVERAGDFLLMAATLMLIKSRTLLPRPDEEDDGLADGELDPRTDLVRQLLEYKRFKDLSHSLREAGRDRERRFGSALERPRAPAADAGKLLEDVGVDDLLLAFERMMKETLADVDHEVFGEVLPMRELAEQLTMEMAAAGGTVAFRDFFAARRDRYYIVSVFLCMLELLRSRRISIGSGGDDLAALRISLRADAEPEDPVRRMS